MTMEINNKTSFQEHNEYMKRFREAHASVAWSNKPKRGELAHLAGMQLWQVPRPVRETGGSLSISGTIDWPNLVPVLNVAGYKLSPN